MRGDVIGGRYRLVEELGHGAMSEVWLAEDEQLERRIALKLLAPHADRRRFAREARAAAALSHPNVERIYEYGEDLGRPYMALEYLPGGSLEERLRPRRPVPDDEAAAIAADVAAGLAHAHAQGLVHRDLKPANILFDAEGRAKIADLGIARLAGAVTLTEDGTVMGTAGYISPEQASGRPASPASDVYSFGVILYRLLTGRLPFEGESVLDMAAMHREVEPPPIDWVRPDAPPRLAAIAAAALVKDPRLRPADGAALAAELGGAPPAATQETVVLPRPPRPSRGPGRRLVGLVALLLLLLAGGITVAAVLTHGSGSGAPTTSTKSPTQPTTHATTAAPPPTSTPSTTAPTTSARATTTTAPPPPPPTTAPTTAPTTTPSTATPTTTAPAGATSTAPGP